MLAMTSGRAPDPAAENRRNQLRRWIDHFFGGSQALFGASTADADKGDRQINQGELSLLLKNKSFGERRARSLELQAQMPRGYLDSTSAPDAAALTPFLSLQAPDATTPRTARPLTTWPFRRASYARIQALRASLGPRKASEAINEIDGYLDALLRKWEDEAAMGKQASGSG